MRIPGSRTLEATAPHPDRLAQLGGWLFKRRTYIPVPIAVALLTVSPNWPVFSLSTSLALFGIPVVAAGELLRLWGVHHIGVISRTRSDRLGPLINTGPFSLVRNPLYLGNILLWLGFAISARLIWLAPLVLLMLAFEYHAIVRWEEHLLRARLGPAYVDYTRKVPRWIPLLRLPTRPDGAAAFSWPATFYSERGTLIAIALGYALLWAKSRSSV